MAKKLFALCKIRSAKSFIRCFRTWNIDNFILHLMPVSVYMQQYALFLSSLPLNSFFYYTIFSAVRSFEVHDARLSNSVLLLSCHQYDDIFLGDSIVNRSIENRSCNLFSSFLYKMCFFSDSVQTFQVVLLSATRHCDKNVQPYVMLNAHPCILQKLSNALHTIVYIGIGQHFLVTFRRFSVGGK